MIYPLATAPLAVANPLFGLGIGLGAKKAAAVSAPVADFTGTPTSGSEPLSVTFTDASTNTPTSWLWEQSTAGAGIWSTFSTVQNPVQSFDSGDYDIRLTATNAGGSSTPKLRSAYIVVGL